jgi:hypothetical protein
MSAITQELIACLYVTFLYFRRLLLCPVVKSVNVNKMKTFKF